MRPDVDMLAADVLRREIPQFEPYYLDLREIYGEDLTPEVVFNEFADFVRNLIDEDEELELIERCFAAIEKVIRTEGVDVLPVVGYAFLDGLGSYWLDTSYEYLGPATDLLRQRMSTRWWDRMEEPISAGDLADIDEMVAQGYL